MASTYLTRTTGTPTLGTKCTVSAWVKISEVPGGGGSDRWIFGEYGNNSNHSYLYLRNSSEIGWYEADGSGTEASIITNRLCRDLNGWYHFMIVYDTTLSTQADRFKMYINGERQTSFSTNTNSLAQNYLPRINKASRTYYIGGTPSYQDKFDGIISHYHHVDGSALDPTVFGSTDALTGEWKINTNPTFTPGNNGFSILKDGNTITDQSANSNNFSLGGGTLTKTEDCPSNIFATLNPLIPKVSSMSFSNGNNTITTSGSQWEGSVTTLAPTKGKWYYEAKYNSGSGIKLDIARETSDLRNMAVANQSYLAYHGNGYGYQLNNSGTDYYCADNSCTTWNSSANGNSTKIYMVAVDLDNGKMWIGANGTWANKSGTANPVTGADPLHEFSAKLNGDPWLFSMSVEGGSGSHNLNFGNGYFGTTAVSSAGTNASNLGIFEYDVPAGYTALSTKGINSF